MKMSDVAKLAGVSESTVSRALNNSPLISEKTRKRIQAIASQNDYVVNAKARSFRIKKTNVIAAIIPFEHAPRQHISDPFFMDMLGVITDYITEHGYDLLISRAEDDKLEQKLRHIQVDGAVFIGQSNLHNQLNKLATSSKIPFIVWGANLEDQNYICISSDNKKGAFDAVSHLARMGHKRIAYIGDKFLPETSLRFQGYASALKKSGLTLDDDLVLHSNFIGENAYNAMRQFLKKNIAIDAVFACSDVIAMNSIKALNDVGFDVPKDVSVIGFDDISASAYCTPALSTVRQNISTGGRLIAENLIRLINGEKVNSVMLPADLVIRAT